MADALKIAVKKHVLSRALTDGFGHETTSSFGIVTVVRVDGLKELIYITSEISIYGGNLRLKMNG